jgi:hypothetical protein
MNPLTSLIAEAVQKNCLIGKAFYSVSKDFDLIDK